MLLRYMFLITLLGCLVWHNAGHPQGQEGFQNGVVRIDNTKLNESGTGFIIAVDTEKLYIVTASHVVKGSLFQNVYFFNNQHIPVKATVIDRERDDLEGLAVLLVTKAWINYSDFRPLTIGKASSLHGGENVQVIGFPGGTTICTFSNRNIARVEGRRLVLSGQIESGNSGGPVLLNEQVIGLVTDVTGSMTYAVPAESILLYFAGVVGAKTIKPNTIVTPSKAIRITEIPRYDPKGGDEFVDIAGEVREVNPDEVKVVLYSFTTKWYVQPEEANPFTDIGQDNKWSARIHPGASYAALLVKSTYRFNTTKPIVALPRIGGDVIALVEVAGAK